MRRSRLNSVSKRRSAELREYSKLRKDFLLAHPKCTVYPNLNSSDIHHMRGRWGARLNETEYWMAVSRSAHREIHDNPAWAKEQGYLLQR